MEHYRYKVDHVYDDGPPEVTEPLLRAVEEMREGGIHLSTNDTNYMLVWRYIPVLVAEIRRLRARPETSADEFPVTDHAFTDPTDDICR